jgi:hypothetical protein
VLLSRWRSRGGERREREKEGEARRLSIVESAEASACYSGTRVSSPGKVGKYAWPVNRWPHTRPIEAQGRSPCPWASDGGSGDFAITAILLELLLRLRPLLLLLLQRLWLRLGLLLCWQGYGAFRDLDKPHFRIVISMPSNPMPSSHSRRSLGRFANQCQQNSWFRLIGPNSAFAGLKDGTSASLSITGSRVLAAFALDHLDRVASLTRKGD